MEIWEPKPPGTLWATPGLLRESFTFYLFLEEENLIPGCCIRELQVFKSFP